jgi:hypothetical protein
MGKDAECKVNTSVCSNIELLEEGRAESKSPNSTFGYFHSISQQEVSADIIQNSAVGNFSPKTEKKDKSS